MMMKRQSLMDERRILNKMSYYVDKGIHKQIIDSHIEALDEIELLKELLAEARNELSYWSNR